MTPEPLEVAFATHRSHLRAVAYRMLGSLSDADDAVQETWLRASQAGTAAVANVGGWLTTITARICLNQLQAAKRPASVHVPDPVIGPEDQAMLAESVGLALQVVLATLAPAERLAFVLHDMFAVPFDDIAPLLAKSPAATRQLASRARRRVREQAPTPDADLAVQRAAVDAFFAAAHAGDFEALVAVLDPAVVLRSDAGPLARLTVVVTGARDVASQALTFGRLSPLAQPALVNGAAGVVVRVEGRIVSVMAFTVAGGVIVAIDVLADAARLRAL